MSTPASRRHPEPEELAAFIEGGLEGADLMSMTEHLSDCMECRALLGNAAAFSRDEMHAATPRKMSAPWWLAAAASIVIVAGAIWMIRLQAQHDPLQRLIAAAPTERRDMEVRLSGFAWAPLRVMRGGEPADPARMRLTGAAGQVLQEARESTSPESRHAAGVAQLLTEQRNGAIRDLNAAARASNDARIWSDLAAAHYASAISDDAPSQFVEALKAADKALALDPELREALFNRALILEKLGQRDPAREAWNRYLAVDPSSDWANEAREHLAALSGPRASFSHELDRRYARLAAGDAEATRELVTAFPQEARTWGEVEILGRWAADGGAQHLAVARALGAALAQRSGETMLSDAVTAIARGDPKLRDAHRIYREGRIAYSGEQPAVAESTLRKAAALFAAAKSPMAEVALYYAACAAFDQDHRAQAQSELERLLGSAAPQHRALRAQVQWQLGLCYGAQAHWTHSLQALRESAGIFAALGEMTNKAQVDGITADVLEDLGAMDDSWRHRMSALAVLGSEQSAFGLSALAAMTRSAMRNRDWDAAESSLRLELFSARSIHHRQLIADALTRTAIVNFRRGESASALRRLNDADVATASITDPATRNREQIDLAAAAAIIAPAASAGTDRAIDFHRTNGRRDLLPSLLLSRAQHHRVRNELEAASRDLAEAFAEIEQQREAAPRGDLRWSVFDASQEVVAESIDLLLARGDPAAALALADRARSRVLLDALSDTSVAPLAASLPPDTLLLEYVRLGERLVAFAADRDGVTAMNVSADRTAIDDLTASFHDALLRNDPVAGSPLYAVLIAPMAERIARHATLVIVPDDTLEGLPFCALFDSRSRRYLIEDHAVIVAPSAAVYTAARRRRETRAGENGQLLIVARPQRDGLQLHADEAEAIVPMYSSVKRLTGAAASRAAFIGAAPAADIVHFAGHGITDARTGSALLLASSATDSGILDTRDIEALSLPRTRTVVLAACGTAVGMRSGYEGPDSVARAFLAAGAPSVIATLWPIDDVLAAPIFISIHRRLARGESAAEAVRQAQLDAIRGATPLSPLIWAAVQTIGS